MSNMPEQQSFNLQSDPTEKPPKPPKIDFSLISEKERERVFLIRKGTSIFFPPNIVPDSYEKVDGIIIKNPNNPSQTAYWIMMSEESFKEFIKNGKKIKPSKKTMIKFETLQVVKEDGNVVEENVYYNEPEINRVQVVGPSSHRSSFFAFPNPKQILIPKKLPGV